MSDEAASASASFEALGNETRMAIVRELTDGRRSFSELFEATDLDTTAGFAYHLRQLSGQFVRKRDDETYELTYAGRAVARAAHAGTYTDSVDDAELPVEDSCPFCERETLTATVTDNVTRVRCGACAVPILQLSFPPSGYAGRDEVDLAAALDTYHRHRIGSFRENVCPDCGGVASMTVEPVDGGSKADNEPAEAEGAAERVPLQAVCTCDSCESTLRCPVSLTVISHPAVVAFYHDHGEDIGDRPLWNVGPEWREEVISEEPWCLCIRTRLGGEALLLYLARDGRVVDTRRRTVPESAVSDASESGTAEEASS